MTPVRILLVTHPGLGEGLLEAAGAILGTEPPVDLISNRGLTGDELETAIMEWLGGESGPRLILTDLPFGSCCQAARLAAAGRGEVGIVAGVNLPVLLAALRSRDQEDLAGLLQHLTDRGAGAVEAFPPETAS